MKKQTKTLCLLVAAVTISSAFARMVAADADVAVKGYAPQVVTRPQPLVPAPQPTYVKEEPKPEVVYHSAVAEPAPQPVQAVPQPIFLSSPTPPPAPGTQKTCNKCNKCRQADPAPCPTCGCNQVQPIAPAPMPCNAAKGECNRVPPADKDGSLFPGGKCSHCTDGEGNCNHVPPADKDGSLFPGGKCTHCTDEKAPEPEAAPAPIYAEPCVSCPQPEPQAQLINFVPYTETVYQAVQRNCCQMAPIALDHVDFRIKDKNAEGLYSNRIGSYRFRIFGCRRVNKDVRLNSKQVMEKNIDFNGAFEKAVDECYKVLPAPRDLCLQAVPTEMPEYVLTAEITDYFMNVCDEYDWEKTENKKQRSGSSEVTVIWRLMDLTRNTTYWKGETSGYGELYEGEADGEIKLIERAFADAASNLRAMTGFEDQLMQRVPFETIAAQRYALIEEERALNPIKCGYRKEYDCANNCVITGPDSDISQCTPTCGCIGNCPTVVDTHAPAETPCVNGEKLIEVNGTKVVVPCETQPAPSAATCYDEQGSFIESSSCQIVDDNWIDTGDVRALDTLCITAANPCKQLTPETVYRLRASVVQIDSPNGKKGAGLLISDRYILTSGDLVDRNNNVYRVKTIRNAEYNARAIRINPSKNTALLMLDESVEYTPLALNLALPEVNRSGFLTLGLLDVKDFKDGEDYLENSAKIAGYRYTEEKGAEILADTFIQNVTVGGALFYKDCTISGMAHSGIKTDDGMDVYVPTETALRSLGISICGQEYIEESPWQQTVYKPVTEQIQIIQVAPEVMAPKERK